MGLIYNWHKPKGGGGGCAFFDLKDKVNKIAAVIIKEKKKK